MALYFLIFLFLLVFGGIQEWNLTSYVYDWLARDSGPSLALMEVLLSFFLAAILGGKLFRQVGLRLLAKAQQQLAQGVVPDRTLAEGFLLIATAVFLILPGYLSDILGLLILLLRKPLSLGLMTFAKKHIKAGRVAYQAPSNTSTEAPVIIDVQAIEEKR